MTTVMDDVLTADDVSRMTGVPDFTLQDWAAKRERGVDSRGPHPASCHPGIGAGCVLMLWNSPPHRGFE
jgi:hypothetical protein